MAGISDSELNELRLRADIVDIISSYIPLNEKGKNYWGVCPFHEDHSPSMSVSKDKQIYKCFSCGAAGNVFSFVENYENVSFMEAVKIVAEKVGFNLSGNISIKKETKFTREYEMMDIALKYFQNTLNTKEGKEAFKYLNDRGLSENDIKEFDIGLSPCNNSLNVLLEKKGFNYNEMMDVGLILDSSNIKDVFSERIMFPIHNIDGNAVAFTGRVYNKEDRAKYLGSKETKIYHKSNILFNYHRAKDAVKLKKEIVLVEGNMDAIRLYINGIKNVVALMGTALTKEQIEIIKKLRCKVILMLDNDNAGEKATYDISLLLENANIETYAVRLSGEKDPDSYILKNGVEAILENIKKKIPINEFKLQYLKKDKNLTNTDDLVKYVRVVIDDLKNSKDEILREVTLKKLSTEYNLSYDILKKQLEEIPHEENKTIVFEKEIQHKKTSYEEAINNILYYMMNDSKYIKLYMKNLGYIDEKKYRLIASEIICYYELYKSINIADFITYSESSKIKDDIMDIINNTMCENFSENIFIDSINFIKKKTKDNEIKELKKKLKTTMDEHEKEEILKKIVNLKIGSGV
ncbi:MAG: DNA primase [Firmicutes bacterium]|nr:DNA primase [Bacillota bacterium]